MPIRPEYKKYYGPEWRAWRLKVIEALGNRCAICGKVFPSSQLSGAHMFHDPRDASQVQFLCFADHARHDARHRLAVMRRTHARRVGQAWLFPEVEWAVFPAWQRPRSVDREAQEVLWPK